MVLVELKVMTSIFNALRMAITALPVSIRILKDLSKVNSEIGQKIISVAIFDEVMALSFLYVLFNLKDIDLSID
ncbi:MAG: Kef-type K+ transport system membrane component KefB [Algoriphagus sp.]